jgi:hypothetical protein
MVHCWLALKMEMGTRIEVGPSASGSAFICAQMYSLPVSITQQTEIQRIFSICYIAILQLIFPGLSLFLTVYKFPVITNTR